MTALTKAMLDRAMSSWLSARPAEDIIIVSPYVHSVFAITNRSTVEMWDRRRTKREMRRIGRKSARREYHKRALDG